MIYRTLCLSLLLVSSGESFSVDGSSQNIRRTVSIQPSSAAFQSTSLSPLFSGVSTKSHGEPDPFFQTTKRTGKRQWIRSLVSRRTPGLVQTKNRRNKRRALATVALALAVWFRGTPSLPHNSFQDANVAHAAAPIAIRFSGAQVSAHGSDWKSMEGTSSSDLLLPVTLPSSREQADKVARRAALTQMNDGIMNGNGNAKIMVVAAAGVLVLVPGAKVWMDRRNQKGQSDDGEPYTQESLEASLLHEDQSDDDKPYTQETLEASILREDDNADGAAAVVNDTQEFKQSNPLEGEANGSLFPTTEKREYLASEIAFLGLSVLFSAASIAFL